ncbi:hypothetical protein D3874_22140 [Oleomonas cavernae]|uniref:Uncharacterized protein n=1 Tax=Oleomonas cavernae TaxID=2320859 RepID=A0A418WHH7_9PROT|nr:hypothetical protein [Oleomonas cavernae]RJF89339.1 hypothetical protein D3874_22140 [Oleomonas cavernae]
MSDTTKITAWVTLLGLIITTGQALTTWIDKRRAESLARIEQQSKIATEFLKMLIEKDTTQPTRLMLWDAISELPEHPLSVWAKKKHDDEMLFSARMAEHWKVSEKIAREKGSTTDEIAKLQAELSEAVELKDKAVREGRTDDAGVFHTKIVDLETKIADRRAFLTGLAEQEAEINREKLAALGGLSRELTPAQASAVAAVINTISVEFVAHLEPSAAERIRMHLPYLLAAFREFGVDDVGLGLAIVAECAHSTVWFNSLTEREIAGRSYEGIAGNIEPGDGVRFRGRGYIFITGKAAYQRMGELLGLGNALLVSPDDAARPETAARIAVALFMERKEEIVTALSAGKFEVVHRIITGDLARVGPAGEIYNRMVASLPVDPASYRVFVQFAGLIERENVKAMMKKWADAGWGVQGAGSGGERTAAAAGLAEVRYGRATDATAAAALARLVEAQKLSERPMTTVFTPIINPGVLEVWVSSK